ncbi:hypothetical protein [Shouchella shacheensis]|uniref:hypothetical protein n=1 Tax=Shouchella shacheensis TaxID=1649580 RepID=UPI0007400AD0|nr:hypothetical protein [Shouchella shacheensis]
MEEIHQLSKDEEEQILKLPNSWIEKGKREGVREGKKEGMKEGMKEGEKEGKKHVALEMLKRGLDLELIAEVTKLDREEIENLRKTL